MASCNIISTTGFDKIMSEFQEFPTHLEEPPNPELQIRILLENDKFKRLFD